MWKGKSRINLTIPLKIPSKWMVVHVCNQVILNWEIKIFKLGHQPLTEL